jgi:hypothetical protein
MLWRRGALALMCIAGLGAPVLHGAGPACAATPHHAALVIDTGSQVVRRCVGFSEDSITGKDVLDRAGVDPVYVDYSGQVFVCSLLGVGNARDQCPNSEPADNWVYFHAAAGSNTFTKAPRGASDTTVHDGDVEGWHWRPGTPPYSSVTEVCPPDAPATTAATQPSQPAGGAATSPAPSPSSGAGTTTARAPAGATATTTMPSDAAGTTTTTSVADGAAITSTTGRQQRLALRESGKGGSPIGLAVVGVMIAGMGVASWRISRRRAAGG